MMPEPNFHINPAPVTGMRQRRFWRTAFLWYIFIEAAIALAGYGVTRMKCPVCVQPAGFYIVNWLLQLAFTGGIWYVLNRYYTINRPLHVLLNVLLFAVWYFVLITSRYGIFLSGQNWLIDTGSNIPSLSGHVYGSWADIGKYVVILAIFYVLRFYYDFRKAERQRVQLAVINKDMQLNLLQQQLSPHFYFNTLNNLYGLARNNNPLLREALQQLHNIMQYVIDDCNQPRVLLRQEIDFLQSYIALEKLRYEQDTVIDMQVQGQPEQLAIVPLLLIQFVENAFKHGMKEKSDQNWMRVRLAVQGRELDFTVENSYYTPARQGGIGMESVRRLLQLQYEDKHVLDIQQQPGHFAAHLKLQL